MRVPAYAGYKQRAHYPNTTEDVHEKSNPGWMQARYAPVTIETSAHEGAIDISNNLPTLIIVYLIWRGNVSKQKISGSGHDRSQIILKKASLAMASLAIGVGALPALTAASAQAATTICTVTPEKPVFAHRHDDKGRKMINYPIRVDCPIPLRVTVYQSRHEDDRWLEGKDDDTGSSSWNEQFGPGARTLPSEHALPETESSHEDVFHKVYFRVYLGDLALTDDIYAGESPVAKFNH